MMATARYTVGHRIGNRNRPSKCPRIGGAKTDPDQGADRQGKTARAAPRIGSAPRWDQQLKKKILAFLISGLNLLDFLELTIPVEHHFSLFVIPHPDACRLESSWGMIARGYGVCLGHARSDRHRPYVDRAGVRRHVQVVDALALTICGTKGDHEYCLAQLVILQQ